jgi:hypothetical protein
MVLAQGSFGKDVGRDIPMHGKARFEVVNFQEGGQTVPYRGQTDLRRVTERGPCEFCWTLLG